MEGGRAPPSGSAFHVRREKNKVKGSHMRISAYFMVGSAGDVRVLKKINVCHKIKMVTAAGQVFPHTHPLTFSNNLKTGHIAYKNIRM